MCKYRKIEGECDKCKKEYGKCIERSAQAEEAHTLDSVSELKMGVGYRLLASGRGEYHNGQSYRNSRK